MGEDGEDGEDGEGWARIGVLAHRGRLLEGEFDAAAGGVLDCLLCVLVETVVCQTAVADEEIHTDLRGKSTAVRHEHMHTADATAGVGCMQAWAVRCV